MVVEILVIIVEELVNEKFDVENIVLVVLKVLIVKFGENMIIRRFIKFGIENGIVKSYIYGGGRIGVLVEFVCDIVLDVFDEVVKEVCM